MKYTIVKFISTLSFLLLSNLHSKAQFECGTHISEEEVEKILWDNNKLPKDLAWKKGDNELGEYVIKLNINIFGLTDINPIIEDAIAEANQHFAPIGISFETCEEPTIHFLNFTSIDSTVIVDHIESMDKLGFLNVYVGSSVFLKPRGYICGAAYYPDQFSPTGGRCRIYISSNCFERGTFMHELGHVFGLLHTHGPSNTIKTDEWVNGCNCRHTGDRICDTPADPNLSWKVSENCEYTGWEIDEFGYAYQPSVENFMSYARVCRNEFTDEQYEKMLYSFHYFWKEILAQEPKDSTINQIPDFAYIDNSDIPLDDKYNITGPGVANNHFSPEKAGVGKHDLFFLDKKNTFLANYINPHSWWGIFSEDTLWQSFIPEYTGTLESIQLPLFPIDDKQENITFTVYLYEGLGLEGTKIAESTVQIPSYLLDDFIENRFEYQSCFTEVPIPSIDVNVEKRYTIQIQAEPIDSIYYVGTYNSFFWYTGLSDLGYESSLTTINYIEAHTLYSPADTFYRPIRHVPADTFISYPNLDGLDSSCLSILTDTIIREAYTRDADTIYRKADTFYREVDTIISYYNIGFSTFVNLAEENCWNQFTKSIQVLPSPISVYPNPTADDINIKYVQNEQMHPVSLEIYSVNGQRIYHESLPSFTNNAYSSNQQRLKIDISNIPAGLYVVSVVYKEGAFGERFLKL